MADEGHKGGRFYGVVDKILLAGILGAGINSTRSDSKVADELEQIRKALTRSIVQVETIEVDLNELRRDHARTFRLHDGRISELELLCRRLKPVPKK